MIAIAGTTYRMTCAKDGKFATSDSSATTETYVASAISATYGKRANWSRHANPEPNHRPTGETAGDYTMWHTKFVVKMRSN